MSGSTIGSVETYQTGKTCRIHAVSARSVLIGSRPEEGQTVLVVRVGGAEDVIVSLPNDQMLQLADMIVKTVAACVVEMGAL